MDFQKFIANIHNISFGNFNIPISEMIDFDFETDDGVSIQNEDFYLQKISYFSATQTFQYENYLQLNNTYKNTGYFEGYDFVSDIDQGLYIIKAGDYIGLEIIKAIDVDISDISIYNYLIDNSGNRLIDNNGDYLVEPI